jgi:hypothetical protein
MKLKQQDRQPSPISHVDTIAALATDWADSVSDAPRLLRLIFVGRIALWATWVVGRKIVRVGAATLPIIVRVGAAALPIVARIGRSVFAGADYIGLEQPEPLRLTYKPKRKQRRRQRRRLRKVVPISRILPRGFKP